MLRSKEPSAQWKVTLPKRVAARVALRLIDPRTGKPYYGGRARLLEILLTDWLDNEEYRDSVLSRMNDLDPEEYEEEEPEYVD